MEATGASTTGNIYGIYDMSGVSQYMMGNIVQEGTELGAFNANSQSGIWDEVPELKYYDSYENDTSTLSHGRGLLGDATRETLKTFGTSVLDGWYSDSSVFPIVSSYWFVRGGFSTYGARAGAFAFDRNGGSPNGGFNFRVVLTLE